MLAVQTRVFWKDLGANADDIGASIQANTTEVNAFLGTFADPSSVLDVVYHIGPLEKYGSRIIHMVSVTYLEDI